MYIIEIGFHNIQDKFLKKKNWFILFSINNVKYIMKYIIISFYNIYNIVKSC